MPDETRYSVLSARIGSTRAARRAGMKLASAATARSMMATSAEDDRVVGRFLEQQRPDPSAH